MTSNGVTASTLISIVRPDGWSRSGVLGKGGGTQLVREVTTAPVLAAMTLFFCAFPALPPTAPPAAPDDDEVVLCGDDDSSGVMEVESNDIEPA